MSLLAACREIWNRQVPVAASAAGAAGAATTKAGGLANFYAGLGVTVAGSMPSVALYFGVYSYIKTVLLGTPRGSENQLVCVAAAAAVGNTVASFSRVPYEVLKQKLQTGQYASLGAAVVDLVGRRGPSAAGGPASGVPGIPTASRWSLIFPAGGIAIQMIRDVPYAIVTLLMYEALQSYFSATATTEDDGDNRKKKKRIQDFAVGGISGGFGSWVTNPMDVVKTRLQTDEGGALYGGSVTKACSEIWKEGGAPAFLRGSVPRLMHKVPANAFFFLFYEVFKRVLRVSADGDDEA